MKPTSKQYLVFASIFRFYFLNCGWIFTSTSFSFLFASLDFFVFCLLLLMSLDCSPKLNSLNERDKFQFLGQNKRAQMLSHVYLGYHSVNDWSGAVFDPFRVVCIVIRVDFVYITQLVCCFTTVMCCRCRLLVHIRSTIQRESIFKAILS